MFPRAFKKKQMARFGHCARMLQTEWVKSLLAGTMALLACSVAFSQGTVRGKVTDENGEAAINAIVMLQSDHSVKSAADIDGNYSVKIPDSTVQVLIITYLGHDTERVSVHLRNGEVLVKNVSLKVTGANGANVIQEFTIVSKAVKANDNYMQKMKMNSVTTVDFISAETMKKTGDPNVVQAVARVSGVSTNGGFITVRGIGDRYVKTAINGSRIPTLDPFTNNLKLDLFPASLVDNVVISKTASPDLPGDWAGAYISVETKDYPDKLSVNEETTFGYNNQVSFKDVLSSQRSSTDWLGFDHNFRDRSHDQFTTPIMEPSQYQQMVGLGLADYYKSMGITGWRDDGSQTSEDYFKLGLVKLGLLGAAQFNDPKAVAAAEAKYNSGPYKMEAFNNLNSGVPAEGKSFPNNWSTFMRKAPLSFSQSFSIGNQTKLFGKTFGFLTGFRYGSWIAYDPGSTSNRASVANDGNGGLVNSISSEIKQQESRETNGWSALLNAACKLNSNNSVSLLFMPNLTGVNRVRNTSDDRDRLGFMLGESQFYEQRKQLVYQLKSEHYIPSVKMKVEANASYTDGKSSAPDFKDLSYTYDPVSDAYLIGPSVGTGLHRYFRYLSENIFDSRISAELPVWEKPGLARKIKFGGAYQANDRRYDQYDYFIDAGTYYTQDIKLTNNDLNQYFSPGHFDIHTYTNPSNGEQSNTIDMFYNRNATPADHTFGRGRIAAGFIMADYTLVSRLRLSGGLRVEQADLFTDVARFDSLQLPPNDPRRQYRPGYPLVNPGKLNETNYLPSANVIYKLKKNEESPINLRVNYSKTVARPSLRELSDVAAYDFENRAFVFGNSNLKPVHISNYDVRLESYFRSGEFLSASVFYKDFRNHIELVRSNGLTWQNVDKSKVQGVELEGKKKITRHFDFQSNVTFVSSRTKYVRNRVQIDNNGIRTFIPQDTVSHPMFGQAPYVVNGILTYTADSIGLSVAISYNVQGPRIVIASDEKVIPDIYEAPRHLLDIKLMKKLGKHFLASITVRDLLNTSIRRYYHYTDGTKLDYDKYTFGTNYLFGIAYKL